MPTFAIWVNWTESSGKGFRSEVEASNETEALQNAQKAFGPVGNPEDHPNFRTYLKELGKLQEMGRLVLSHPIQIAE
jgi:hypothetical protein